MRAVPTKHERFCIEKLKALGMFTNITIGKDDIGQGIIIAPCSDGDQFDDVYGHIAGVCKETVATNRIHTIALNGGAILMGDQLESRYHQHGDIMLNNILVAREIKKIDDVFLYTHFPCAIARANDLSVVDQGVSLMAAKDRLKQDEPSLRVRCFFHLDLFDETENGTHKRRTYFMPKSAWNKDNIVYVLHQLLAAF